MQKKTYEEILLKISKDNSVENQLYLETSKSQKEKIDFLTQRSIDLLLNDISHKYEQQSKEDSLYKYKISEVKSFFDDFNKIQSGTIKNTITDRIKTFASENNINSLKSKYSQIGKFHKEIDNHIFSPPKNLNIIYNMCLFFRKEMEKSPKKEIKYYDVFRYLIKQKVCKNFKEHTVNTIKGDYLLFRRSERNQKSINISLISLTYDKKHEVFTFNSKRRGINGNIEDIDTEGIFLQNSAKTFLFLALSVTSSGFSFIETITTFKTRPKKENNYIVGLYNGEILSNTDYDNRPFSSKVVLVKIESNELLKVIKKNSSILLKDHQENNENNELSYIEEFSKLFSQENRDIEKVETLKERNKKLYDVLEKINEVTKLSIILEKIKTVVDKHYDLLILKD